MARPAIYRPRRPQESALYQSLEQYWEEFQQAYTPLYEKDYGPLRPVVEKTVERFLECGILRHGFARVRCGHCREEYLLAFSCKTRTNNGVTRCLDALDWIVLVTSHIPDSHQQMVRIYSPFPLK